MRYDNHVHSLNQYLFSNMNVIIKVEDGNLEAGVLDHLLFTSEMSIKLECEKILILLSPTPVVAG